LWREVVLGNRYGRLHMPGKLIKGSFEIFKGDAEGLYGFRLRSSHGSALVQSLECYSSKDACLRAIELVQGLARGAVVVDLTQEG
jgi:uncharacterized protein YegP (UPF0339 family)